MSTSVLSHSPKWHRAARVLALLGVGVAMLSSHAHVQAQQPYPPGATPSPLQPAGDPPGRVARLSDASGEVWLSSLDSPEWISADRNRPLTNGDRLAVDKGGRAELTLGSTTLRLDEGTELEVTQLDDARFAVQLLTGSVAARFRNPQSAAEFELDTDEGRFRALQPGRYRFDRDTRSSDVTVYGGQAIFEGRNSALPVNAGQHIEFWLDAAGAPQYNTVAAERDAFAAWNDDRDRAENRYAVTPNRYVSPEMTGAQDLDRYGVWQQDADYGPVWIPRDVPADWAPYSSGHWAFVQPWGWTWVDDAAWGFAPFHYGRWVNRRNVWCWTPGAYVARPIYAPALVAWVGGPRVNGSISIGGGRGDAPIGWFPLGPREVFVPGYRHSPRYVRNINIVHVTNVVNITNVAENRGGAADRRTFMNRDQPHAMTVVGADVIVNREPVRANASRFGDSPAMRALKDQRASPVSIAAPVAAPPPSMRGRNDDVRQRPPGFAAMPRNDRADRGDRGDRNDRSDRGSEPRNERGGFGRPSPAVGIAPPAQAAQPGVGPATRQTPAPQPVVQPAAAPPAPNGQPGYGNGQPALDRGQPSNRDRLADRPADRGGDRGVDRGGDRGGDRTNDRGGDRFGDRSARPSAPLAPVTSPLTSPAAAPAPIVVAPPPTRPDVGPQAAPAGVIPSPRERFQRPATPNERAPSFQAPGPAPAVSPPVPSQPAMAPIDNNRRPVQANDDARAAQRAERGERRERGEPGQAPASQRMLDPVRQAPVVVVPPPPAARPAPATVAPPAPPAAPAAPATPAPVVRSAPPPRPAEATRAEPSAREERREERRDPGR